MAAGMAAAMPIGAAADHKQGHGNPGPNAGDPTISATPNPVVWGRSVRITGRLKGSDRGGKTIELQHDPHPFGTTYETVATTTTNADGDYAFNVLPDRNTNYRAVAKVATEQFSPNLQVGVRVRVTRQVSDTTPNIGQVVTFTGRVRPAHDGATVYVQRRRADGSWRTKARAVLADGGDVDSRYTRELRITRDGVYRALVKTHADHLGNKSRRVRLDVP